MKTFRSLWGTLLVMLSLFVTKSICYAQDWEPTVNQTIFQGDCKRLVLLVETRDRRFYTPDANAEYDAMLNGENYSGLGCVGSAREFLIDNSGGKFRPKFVIVGPIELSHTMGWYCGKVETEGERPGNNGDLVVEACKLANELRPDIDFSEFDYNKDGKVDNVYLFHSGPNDPGYPTPWPHASGVGGGNLVIDGVLIDSYAISQEMATETVRGAYSTFLHEFGHTLGMPDDYSGRLGRFSIYCDGTFDGGVIPVNLNAAERLILGWLDYDVIDEDDEYTLEPLAKNKALMLKTNNPDEYFLFSNRQNGDDITPWDAKFEYGGMLVWHIDRSQNRVRIKNDNGTYTNMTALGMWHNNSPNAGENHPCHELIEGDNINNPREYRAGMYFPGPGYRTELNSRTHSEFRTWSGAPVSAEIFDIRQEDNGNITFKVKNVKETSVTVNVKNEDGISLKNVYVSLAPAKEEVSPSSRMRMLRADENATRYTAVTDNNGICHFSGIPSGRYQLLVDHESYLVYSKFVDIASGENSFDVTLQTPSDYNLTKLTWFDETKGLHAQFFVPGQVRGSQWTAEDLTEYVGQQLSHVDVWLGGLNHITLWIFKNDEVILKKDIPKEQMYDNGITNIDITADNIIIEEGCSYKVGYQIMEDVHAEWPSTCVSPMTPNKGSLIYVIEADTWFYTNDLNVDWGVFIYLATEFEDKPIEAIEFDDSYVELSVGETKELHVNVTPLDVVNRKMTYSTSDESIVSVSPDGKITANATGDAVITAAAASNPDITASCEVHVKMNGEMVSVRAWQRSAKISWPGENPDYKWLVRYRVAGDSDYNMSTEELSKTEVWLENLVPETEYEAVVQLAEGEASPVEFSFTTKSLTSDYCVIELSETRPKVGDIVAIVLSNIPEGDCPVVFKVNGTEIDGHEYEVVEARPLTITAEVTFKDGSVEKIVKETDVKQ